MDRVKLTKQALNSFIGWTTSRYNKYLGYGTKKEAVNLAFVSISKGYYDNSYTRKDGTILDRSDKSKTVFEIKCASPVGESGTNKRGSYWNTSQGGDEYTVDCINKTITTKYSKKTIKFI